MLRDGRLSDAEQKFRQAMVFEPRNFHALIGLGMIALERSQFERAVTLLEQACANAPREAKPRVYLGNAFARMIRYDDAIASYDAALAINAREVDTLFNRATTLLCANRAGEAVAGFKQVLRLAPNHGNALFNLATAALLAGQWDSAEETCRRLLRRNPNNLDAHIMLLNALVRKDKAQEADAAMNRALDLCFSAIDAAEFPHEPLGQNILALGLVLSELDESGRALALYDRALVKFARSVDLHLARGRVLIDLLQPEQAIVANEQALALKPGIVDALNHRAIALSQLGRFDAAIEGYDRALRAGGTAAVLVNIAAAKKFKCSDDRHLLEIERQLRRSELAVPERAMLHFAAGKAFDDIGRYDDAFRHFALGNPLKRQLSLYEVDADLRQAELIGQSFDREWLSTRLDSGFTDHAPIFVFGMPRSGTTLVEQVIGAHPDAEAIGETGFFHKAARATLNRCGDGSIVQGAQGMSAANQIALGRSYAELACKRAQTAGARHVDKTLDSALHAGLIAAALPKAVLIHVRRDPLDNGLACYSKLFTTGLQFTYDLGDIARYRLSFDSLMAQWRNTLPRDRFLEIDYEELVFNFEREARRLLAFCGLTWSPSILDFAHVQRAVSTASAFQVRQGLFSSSVGRWRNYGAHLRPLAQGLGIPIERASSAAAC